MRETQAGLDRDLISKELNTEFIGRPIAYHARVGSTNDIAKSIAESGQAEGALIIAEEQVQGRGRFERSWIAPPYSSLLMSFILRPRFKPEQVNRPAMAVSLGATQAIRSETGLGASCKWPNDILVNSRKCGGILSEANIVGGRIDYLIIGLGLNVNFSAPAAGLPADATTISDELGNTFPRERLLITMLKRIEENYARVIKGASLRSEWASCLETLGRPVRAQTPWGVETGIAEDVDDEGALLLRRVDGSLVQIASADVTLKPSGEPK